MRDAVPRHLPSCLAGVDGGGTGTRVLLQSLEGRILGRGFAGPSSLSLGIPQAWAHIQQALAAAYADAGLACDAPPATGLALGLAGAGLPALCTQFRESNPGHPIGLLVSDGVTQLAGAHAGGPGVVVAAGTGTVAGVLQRDGRERRSGGWGWPVGDEGGGAWLGLQAVRTLQHSLDGRAEDGPLAKAAAAEVGANPEAVLHWCAQAGQHAYARLAPLVFDAADAGDLHARALLQSAARHLAELVDALCDEPASAGLPVVLTGSVGLRLAPCWPQALRSRLVPPQGDSASGALLLLRRAWNLPPGVPGAPDVPDVPDVPGTPAAAALPGKSGGGS